MRTLPQEILSEFLSDLPVMAAAGLVYWFVRLIVQKKRLGADFREIRRKARLNEVIGLLLVMWAVLIVCSTLLPPWDHLDHFRIILPPHWRVIPELITAHGINVTSHELLNVLMFAPIGLALPFVLNSSKFGQTLLAGFCFTFSVEFLQGFTSLRDGNIDDVICNTIGAAIGYLLYLLMKLLFPKLTEKCKIKAKR